MAERCYGVVSATTKALAKLGEKVSLPSVISGAALTLRTARTTYRRSNQCIRSCGRPSPRLNRRWVLIIRARATCRSR